MSFVSRGARAAARPLRRSIQHPPRRYAGHEAGHGHGHDAHHSGESAFHVAVGSGNESFGRGFYVAVASIPFAFIIYWVASSPTDNALNRLVKRYEAGKDAEHKRDAIHTTMMEQAAADRQMFAATPREDAGPSLRWPESLNAGSPWNVSAGRGTADLSALTKFYEDRNREAEAQRIERLKKNKGSIYD